MKAVAQHETPRRGPPAPSEPPRVFVVVCTHTTRHLGPCLASLVHQTTPPAGVVVSSDTQGEEVPALMRAVLGRLSDSRPPIPVLLTDRPHQGAARINQVRNNGVRALTASLAPDDRDIIVILDGDTMLAGDAIARHAMLGARADLIIPYRINLAESDCAALDPEALIALGPDEVLRPTNAQRRELARLHRNYSFHLSLARFGLTKPHKPKCLGGHHAVRARVMRAVDGYDEAYEGYGFDDDDFSLRVHMLRPRVRVAIAVSDILAWHLWHPTRAPQSPMDSPDAPRFHRAPRSLTPEFGLSTSKSQPRPRIVRISEHFARLA